MIALLLGIVGGILLLVSLVDTIPRFLEGRSRLGVESLVIIGVGVIAIISSAMIWKGSYFAGGVINIVIGVIAIFYGRNSEGVLILVSGVLGVVAPQVKD